MRTNRIVIKRHTIRLLSVHSVCLALCIGLFGCDQQQNQPLGMHIKTWHIPAPPLNISTWIQGEAPENYPDNGIYVIDFWATWCPPCRQSIPHLDRLQRKYAPHGVRIIGVSTEETKTVEHFVLDMDEAMIFDVAIDNEHQTYDAYMTANSINSIPYSFVVANGYITWQGHPMDGLEEALDFALESSTIDQEQIDTQDKDV